MPLKSIYFVVVIIALGLPVHSAFAQHDQDPSLPGSSFEIAGQVRSPNGQKPSEYVDVRLERAGGSLVDQRTTDSNGRFRFSRLSPGQYTVSAHSPGFTIPPQQVDISRFIPRAFLLLQLVPEPETFASRISVAAVIDARIPEKANAEFEKGRAALENKQFEEGIAHLKKALSIFHTYYEAQMLIGTAYMDHQKLDEADQAFHHALEINPKSVPAMVSLAELQRRQKKYSDAEQLLLGALKLEDDAWVAHYTLGRVYWEINGIVKAGRQVGRTIQLAPGFPDAHLLGGNIFMRLGMPQNALVEYKEYLRLAPDGQQAPQTRELVQKLTKAGREKKP